jgi:hypothetical protein
MVLLLLLLLLQGNMRPYLEVHNCLPESRLLQRYSAACAQLLLLPDDLQLQRIQHRGARKDEGVLAQPGGRSNANCATN